MVWLTEYRWRLCVRRRSVGYGVKKRDGFKANEAASKRMKRSQSGGVGLPPGTRTGQRALSLCPKRCQYPWLPLFLVVMLGS